MFELSTPCRIYSSLYLPVFLTFDIRYSIFDFRLATRPGLSLKSWGYLYLKGRHGV